MADPLSISASVVGLVSFAITSSVKLYGTIRDFQSRDKKARSLKNELGELTAVLQSLLDTVTNNPDLNFDALKVPLHRCGNACQEYGELISRCTKHSTDSRASIRDWVTQKYLQGDINDFKDMLATYKATINIALANANIDVAAVTPQVLEDYKDMIYDATQDLKEHMQNLDQKIDNLSAMDGRSSNYRTIEWQAMIEEKKSTQQSLRICAQLSAQIEQLEPIPDQHAHFVHLPSAHKYVKAGLDSTRRSVQTCLSQLYSHESEIDKQLDAMKQSSAPLSNDATIELARLRETKDSIHQCITVISNAEDALTTERQNVFEDITLADDAYNFTISTIGDLVTARRINLTGRSRNIGGQISDESYQKTIEAFAKQGINDTTELAEALQSTVQGQENEFHGRHGRGFKLSYSDKGLRHTESSS